MQFKGRAKVYTPEPQDDPIDDGDDVGRRFGGAQHEHYIEEDRGHLAATHIARVPVHSHCAKADTEGADGNGVVHRHQNLV